MKINGNINIRFYKTNKSCIDKSTNSDFDKIKSELLNPKLNAKTIKSILGNNECLKTNFISQTKKYNIDTENLIKLITILGINTSKNIILLFLERH
jgi:hypothetical protein